MASYGSPDSHSAMAWTVGIPSAVAARQILRGMTYVWLRKVLYTELNWIISFLGEISRNGVLVPISSDIYEPMLGLLEKENIRESNRVTYH